MSSAESSSGDFLSLDDVITGEQDEDDLSAMGAWVPVGSKSCLRGLGPTQMEIL